MEDQGTKDGTVTGSKADQKKDSTERPLLKTEVCSDFGFIEPALKCMPDIPTPTNTIRACFVPKNGPFRRPHSKIGSDFASSAQKVTFAQSTNAGGKSASLSACRCCFVELDLWNISSESTHAAFVRFDLCGTEEVT